MQDQLDLNNIPNHVAIIMDGNGRWAKRKFLPRFVGHAKGLNSLENTVKYCIRIGIKELTVFAFSTENWKRPIKEIDFLMSLFLRTLESKVKKLHKNNIKLNVIGCLDNFSDILVNEILKAQQLTKNNDLLKLNIAANYGGRWDILQSINKLIAQGYTHIVESDLTQNLSLGDTLEPDLLIRTGGEMRISNFMLWQMAYTEFYFTDTLWPDFNQAIFNKAILSFQKRERRFGKSSEQLPINLRRI